MHGGFVGDKRPKLMERPTMQGCSLGPSSRDPCADTLKVFKDNRTPSAFSRSNNTFTDTMIDSPREAGFFPRALAAQLAGTRGVPQRIEMGTAVDRAITIRRDIDDTKVHAQHISGLSHWRIGIVGAHKQTPTSFLIPDKVGLCQFACGSQLFPLFAPYRQWHFDTTIRGRNARKGSPKAVESRRIEHHGSTRTERVLVRLVGLVGRGDYCDGTHRVLCQQAKLLPHGCIYQWVQRKLSELLSCPRFLTDVVTGSVELPLQAFQQDRLFGGRAKRQGDGAGSHRFIDTIFTREGKSSYAEDMG
jgi:hypothetical protein